jgi:hypothetical protein
MMLQLFHSLLVPMKLLVLKLCVGRYMILYPIFRAQHTCLMKCNVINTVTNRNHMLGSYKTVQLAFI